MVTDSPKNYDIFQRLPGDPVCYKDIYYRQVEIIDYSLLSYAELIEQEAASRGRVDLFL